MELAQHRNESPTRNSNCRCAGIAGSRRKSGRAFAWNGRMPARAARDTGFFERATDSCARIADTARCVAVQQACAKRTGRRSFSYDLLMRCVAIFFVALFAMGFEAPGPDVRRAAVGDLRGLLPTLRRAFSADAPEFGPIPKPDPYDWLTVHAELGQTFEEFK